MEVGRLEKEPKLVYKCNEQNCKYPDLGKWWGLEVKTDIAPRYEDLPEHDRYVLVPLCAPKSIPERINEENRKDQERQVGLTGGRKLPLPMAVASVVDGGMQHTLVGRASRQRRQTMDLTIPPANPGRDQHNEVESKEASVQRPRYDIAETEPKGEQNGIRHRLAEMNLVSENSNRAHQQGANAQDNMTKAGARSTSAFFSQQITITKRDALASKPSALNLERKGVSNSTTTSKRTKIENCEWEQGEYVDLCSPSCGPERPLTPGTGATMSEYNTVFQQMNTTQSGIQQDNKQPNTPAQGNKGRES